MSSKINEKNNKKLIEWVVPICPYLNRIPAEDNEAYLDDLVARINQTPHWMTFRRRRKIAKLFNIIKFLKFMHENQKRLIKLI